MKFQSGGGSEGRSLSFVLLFFFLLFVWPGVGGLFTSWGRRGGAVGESVVLLVLGPLGFAVGVGSQAVVWPRSRSGSSSFSSPCRQGVGLEMDW